MEKISKYLSLILRHQPEKIGLILDQEGWANIQKLIDCSVQHGTQLSKETLMQIVQNNDKKRFQISKDSLSIRAVQGHSHQSVQRIFNQQKPPPYLLHGTTIRFWDSIQQQGLIAGKRHYVHLTESRTTAEQVGQRYGRILLLQIDAHQMLKDGYTFFLSENNVWLTEHVPIQYIKHIG